MPTGRAASAELVAGTADAATGNKTQALLSSVARPELRVVLTLAECRYRVVARWSAGITGVADLRGKRIAYTPNTSSQYFLLDLLRLGGVAMGEIVPVLLEPAEMPAALAEGRIDAMAIWEPQPQVALERLGGDAVVLANPAPDAYVERFGLNTTAAVLGDPGRRVVLVNALRAINQMSRRACREPAPIPAGAVQGAGDARSGDRKGVAAVPLYGAAGCRCAARHLRRHGAMGGCRGRARSSLPGGARQGGRRQCGARGGIVARSPARGHSSFPRKRESRTTSDLRLAPQVRAGD